jgi:hypothetical protein
MVQTGPTSSVPKKCSVLLAGVYGTIEIKPFFMDRKLIFKTVLDFFKETFYLVMHRAKPSLKEGM